MSITIVYTFPIFKRCAQNNAGTIVALDLVNTLYKITLSEILSSAPLVPGGQSFSIDIDSSGYIYISCGDGSIQKYNPDLTFFGYIFVPGTFPTLTWISVGVSSNDTLYFAIVDTLYRNDNGAPVLVTVYGSRTQNDIAFDVYDNIYIASSNAIFKINPYTYSVTTLLLGSFISVSVAPDRIVYYSDGNGNLGKINKDTSTTICIPASNTFYSNFATSLISGQIISSSDNDGYFYIYTPEPSIIWPDSQVYAIYNNDGTATIHWNDPPVVADSFTIVDVNGISYTNQTIYTISSYAIVGNLSNSTYTFLVRANYISTSILSDSFLLYGHSVARNVMNNLSFTDPSGYLYSPYGVTVDVNNNVFFASAQASISVLTKSNTTLFGVSCKANHITDLSILDSDRILEGAIFTTFDEFNNLFIVDLTKTLCVLPQTNTTIFGVDCSANRITLVMPYIGYGITFDSSWNLFVSIPTGLGVISKTDTTIFGIDCSANSITDLSMLDPSAYLIEDIMNAVVDNSGNVFILTISHLYVLAASPTIFGVDVTINQVNVISSLDTLLLGGIAISLAFDSQQNLYIGSLNEQRYIGVLPHSSPIFGVDVSVNVLNSISLESLGQVVSPAGLAFDKGQNLYIADSISISVVPVAEVLIIHQTPPQWIDSNVQATDNHDGTVTIRWTAPIYAADSYTVVDAELIPYPNQIVTITNNSAIVFDVSYGVQYTFYILATYSTIYTGTVLSDTSTSLISVPLVPTPQPITKPLSKKALRAANSFPSSAMRLKAIAGREIIRSIQGGAKKNSISADITTTYAIGRAYILGRTQQ